MYADIVISNVFNFNKKNLFLFLCCVHVLTQYMNNGMHCYIRLYRSNGRSYLYLLNGIYSLWNVLAITAAPCTFISHY